MKNQFIENGRELIVEIEQENIEKQVKEKYENDLKNANLFRKINIHIKIRHEIRKKIKKIAPRSGLYVRNDFKL